MYSCKVAFGYSFEHKNGKKLQRTFGEREIETEIAH
jgi:hypothetical protein